MDLKAVRSFQTVVKHGSFIRAAEELNYAQSTVTMQIQRLEAELGLPLIERGKTFRLTEAGRLFHTESLQITASMDRLKSSLEDAAKGEAGEVRIGVTEPAASYRLPRILREFMTAYPNIRIDVEISNTPGLSDKVLRGEVDFALCTTPDNKAGLQFEKLYREEFVALIQERHPLAEKDRIEPEDLEADRLLVTSETCPYRRKLEAVLRERGLPMPATMEIGSMTALKYYAAEGMGIALVPKVVVVPGLQGVTARPLGDSLISMNIGLLGSSGAYPLHLAGQRLYRHFQRELPPVQTR